MRRLLKGRHWLRGGGHRAEEGGEKSEMVDGAGVDAASACTAYNELYFDARQPGSFSI